MNKQTVEEIETKSQENYCQMKINENWGKLY